MLPPAVGVVGAVVGSGDCSPPPPDTFGDDGVLDDEVLRPGLGVCIECRLGDGVNVGGITTDVPPLVDGGDTNEESPPTRRGVVLLEVGGVLDNNEEAASL